jgi:hypothetical protein
MATRKVILSERELTTLIKKIVRETQEREVEEGWLGDKMKNVKRFTTGYGDESEKGSAEEKFKKSLSEIEDEVLEDVESFVYEDEEGWEMAKQDLMDEAEDNNFLGQLKIMHPRRTGKSKVMYMAGRSPGGRLMADIGSAAGSGMRSSHTFGSGGSGGSLG